MTAGYQQVKGNAKEIDLRLHDTVVLVLGKFDDKFSQCVQRAINVGGVGVERFLGIVTSVDLVARLRT